MFRPMVTVTALCLAISVLIGQEPQPPAKPKDLSLEQREKLKERDRLKAEVERLRREEKWAEAIAAGEKQLAVERDVWGDLHDDFVASLNQLADLHEEREDWPAAKKHREQVCRILTNRYGKDDWRAGDAQRAVADGERRERMLPEERRELKELGRLDDEARRLYGKAQYREAAHLCRKALTIRKNVLGPNDPHTAASLNNLGLLLMAQRDYAAARTNYEQALAIYKEVLGPEHPHTAMSLNSLGNLLSAEGDYAGARPCYEQALATRQKVLGPEDPDTAKSLNNLGNLLWRQGDYAGARRRYEKALAIFKTALGPEHHYTAKGLNDVGVLLRDQGDYAGARPYYEQALAIYKNVLGPDHRDTAGCLNNLGILLQAQEDYAGARRCYEEALAIFKKVLGPEHPHTAMSLNSLGNLLSAEGDYAGARPYYEQALAMWKKALGPEHPHTAAGQTSLGVLLSRQRDYAGARPYFEQALAIYKKVLGPEHADTAACLGNLGLFLSDQGDYAGARRYYEQALAITQKNLGLVADGLSERQQLAISGYVRYQLNNYLLLAIKGHVPAPSAFGPVLASKGAGLARQRRARLARTQPELRETWDAIQSASNRLAKLAFESPDPKQREIWRRQLDDATREKEELEVKLMRESAAFRRQKELQRLTPEQLQKVLPAGAALIDFLEFQHFRPPAEAKGKREGERHLVAFVVRANQPVVLVNLGPAAPVDTAVEEWRKGYGADDGAAAADLRRLVWQLVEAHVKDAKVVLISPDGVLSRFPFAALPGKEPGTYLIEERALAVIPVPQLLPELFDPREKEVEPSLLLVGDVDYGAEPGKPEQLADARQAGTYERSGVLGKWTRLPGTRDEVETIRATFRRRFDGGRLQILGEGNATESALRRDGSKHRYLHLATHGFFADKEIKSALAPAPDEKFRPGDLFQHATVTGFHPGLLSGLVLTGANAPKELEQDDGILTALEVASLDLVNVDLAVLSACQTGLGEVAGGEGLLGLQRAFQTAGARSVVAGLWKVPDRGTQMLMTRFYENLWDKKMPKLEALRQAQIWMLREVPKDEKLLNDIRRDLGDDKPEVMKLGDGRLPPYYWAGFVLSGDWR